MNVMNDGRTKHTPKEFVAAHNFLITLRNHRAFLTLQEMSDLRERALRGDVEGAYYALNILLTTDRKLV